jgi:hypothetical protein
MFCVRVKFRYSTSISFSFNLEYFILFAIDRVPTHDAEDQLLDMLLLHTCKIIELKK